MNFQERIEMVRKSIPILGKKETLKAAIIRLCSYDPIKDDSFDRKYKTETSSLATIEDLFPSGGNVLKGAHDYIPIAETVERFILKNLNIVHEDYDFVDIGCGKGRSIMLASDFPFRSITGIEISKTLCAIAKKKFRYLPVSKTKM